MTSLLLLFAAQLLELNRVPAAEPGRVIVIEGAQLIDGRGGPPVADSVVVVREGKIAAAGPRVATRIPPGAERFDASGLTMTPGLIDSHFHLDRDEGLPELYLQHGITSVRDPGAWIEAYEKIRKRAAPRLFLSGPHLDQPPPAYPNDAMIVRDAEETRLAVSRAIDDGASVIKVYFRLPLALIRTAVETAHNRGVPVTGHLEIVDAADAILAGLDGIEHITSFGVALQDPRAGERYRQQILADNNARRKGRYEVWSKLDFDTDRSRALLKLIRERRVFVSATLAVFERRAGDANAGEAEISGFRKMLEFAGRIHSAGGILVPGSHSSVPHAQRGWAYQRELELLVEAGMTPLQAITAGTFEQARFFRIADRLGSIAPGKTADLILVGGDPSKNIAAMRDVRRVMLNGRWVESKP